MFELHTFAVENRFSDKILYQWLWKCLRFCKCALFVTFSCPCHGAGYFFLFVLDGSFLYTPIVLYVCSAAIYMKYVYFDDTEMRQMVHGIRILLRSVWRDMLAAWYWILKRSRHRAARFATFIISLFSWTSAWFSAGVAWITFERGRSNRPTPSFFTSWTDAGFLFPPFVLSCPETSWSNSFQTTSCLIPHPLSFLLTSLNNTT